MHPKPVMEKCPQSPHASTPGWLPLVPLALGAVSGVWVVGARGWFPTWHGFPNTASTTVLFLAAVAAASRSMSARYRWSIVAGLGCSAVGDAFLMQTRDYFLPGLASFLAAHLCYLWAFTSNSRLAGHKPPFLVSGVVGAALVSWLWPGVPASLRLPVIAYAAAILAMAAQATSRALSRRDAAAILAAVGAALFVVSDAGLAGQRFREPLEWGRLLVLGTYFAAQASIALSAILPHRSGG